MNLLGSQVIVKKLKKVIKTKAENESYLIDLIDENESTIL
jgi:hypothetical protein